MSSFIDRYKTPFIISIVMSLAVMLLADVSTAFGGILAILGGITGIFMMDLEFLLYAHLIEPNAPESVEIKSTLKSKSFLSYVRYLNTNEYSFKELPLRSVLFQVLLIIFGYYIVMTSGMPFGLALILSLIANIFYMQIIEIMKLGDLDRWFWVYNGDVSKQGSITYLGGLGLAFLGIFFFI